jgi:hypothetical protein
MKQDFLFEKIISRCCDEYWKPMWFYDKPYGMIGT